MAYLVPGASGRRFFLFFRHSTPRDKTILKPGDKALGSSRALSKSFRVKHSLLHQWRYQGGTNGGTARRFSKYYDTTTTTSTTAARMAPDQFQPLNPTMTYVYGRGGWCAAPYIICNTDKRHVQSTPLHNPFVPQALLGMIPCFLWPRWQAQGDISNKQAGCSRGGSTSRMRSGRVRVQPDK